MRKISLHYAKARKKILISTITALLITAQLSPVAIAGMSESELRGCLTGAPKTVVVAETSTTAEKNSAELQEKYGITTAKGVTSDYKYGKRTSVVTKEITYAEPYNWVTKNGNSTLEYTQGFQKGSYDGEDYKWGGGNTGV